MVLYEKLTLPALHLLFPPSPRSRSQVEPYDFCACVQKLTQKEVLFLDLE